jgi:hypothetical protein
MLASLSRLYSCSFCFAPLCHQRWSLSYDNLVSHDVLFLSCTVSFLRFFFHVCLVPIGLCINVRRFLMRFATSPRSDCILGVPEAARL